MNLPVEALNEFQKIYQRKLGVVITTGEAGIKAENFLKLMMLIAGKPEIEVKNTNINKDEK